MTDARQKFQEKLRELFQFEAADLDFGIYRIMNYRREAIERFIEKDLLDAVGKELASGTLADQSKAADDLEKVKQQLLAADEQAVDADGLLAEDWRNKTLGKEYLKIQARLGGGQGKAEHEALVFNHLYTFFSRYYDAGDFLSLRRYSKKERYAIPYNGEEVHLHWANSDQYFIKTGENFTDYAFRSGAITVRFKLLNAETEQDNRKAEKRCFFPQAKDAGYDAKAKVLTIPFEYRQLTEQEAITYGKKNQQDAIIAAALTSIPKAFKDESAAITALMAERRKTADGDPVSYLEHHLRSYARRNTMDYFIHKDLRGFLERELDFYLKNEVLNLDEVTAGGETLGQAWFQIMRTIRSIGGKIIAFVAQIEDFQKRLFEKRKFVTATHYAVTMGQIPEKLHEEIAGNEAQWQEWKQLLHIDEEAGDKDLFTPKTKKARRLKFLKDHPTLVLDTRHFDPTFKDDLLATFDNLDHVTDGLLFDAENFQALNLMQQKFREKVKCIYIDPPYNTGGDGFPYKDDYQHSSWISMLCDRVFSSLHVMQKEGVYFSSIDDRESMRLRWLMDRAMGPESLVSDIAVVNNFKGRQDRAHIATAHEHLFMYAWPAFDSFGFPLSDAQIADYDQSDEDGLSYTLRDLRKRGGNDTRTARPNLYFPVYWDAKKRRASLERQSASDVEIRPLKSDGTDGCWRWGRETISDNLDIIEARKVENSDRWNAFYRVYLEANGEMRTSKPKSVWAGTKYSSDAGIKALRALLPDTTFASPKAVGFLADVITHSTCDDEIVLDYFGGSGTTFQALIQVNRLDGGMRRSILVELGVHFNTVVLPRIKKVIFTPEWQDGKPKRPPTKEEAKRSPRIIKYHRLESYEDALNNIQLDDAAGQTALRFDDYLLHYMLDWESKDCETFLNVGKLASPFSYKLVLTEGQETREQAVDLPETFAYLMGLHIETRRVHLDKGRRYLVHRGTCGTRKTAVIWRDTAGWTETDRKRDVEFVAKEKLAEGAADVFVNGDSHIPNARSLDPVFKQRMFAGVGAGG